MWTITLWLAAAPAFSFATPLASPDALSVGKKTSVLMLVHTFGDKSTRPASLAVERVGGGVVGQLNDSGAEGDAQAGDGIFAGRFELTPATRVAIVLRAVAEIDGQKVASPTVEVAVLPKGAPTELSTEPAAPVVVNPVTGQQFVADQLIACFGAKVPFEEISKTVGAVQGRLAGRFPLVTNCYQVRLPATGKASTVLDAIARLQKRAGVVSAEVNGIMKVF